jgi:hypothetical protein
MHIITVVTHSENYFPYLVESCKRNGSELVILGYGEKWTGFNMKYKKMIEYLSTVPKDDIVCFVDGYDVICTRNLNDLEEEFFKIKKKTNCKMIVGDEKTFFLNAIVAPLYFGKCKNKSLNSGTYIGYAGEVLDIIQKIYNLNPKDEADDQLLMTEYCRMNDDIYVDTENKIFLTMAHALYDLDKDVKYYNGLTYQGNHPFFIHAPSYGILDTIIKKLGYGECNVRYILYNHFFNKKVLLYAFEMKYLIIFIFIIILFLFYKSIYKWFKNVLKIIKR